MPDVSFPVAERSGTGYLALPASGKGPGVLVLTSWWGLNEFYRSICDRLAQNGFVALGVDYYQGKIARTIPEAEQVQQEFEERDNGAALFALVKGATEYLRAHPAVQGNKIGIVAASMGGYYAFQLVSALPDIFAAVVLIYTGSGADVSDSRAQYQFHFAENDPYEQMELVTNMAGPNLERFIYPNTSHWFIETDRPEYDAEATDLVWERAIAFLNRQLK